MVGRSKTEAGAGRIVPLTRRACAALSLWLARFSDADSDSFVFTSYRLPKSKISSGRFGATVWQEGRRAALQIELSLSNMSTTMSGSLVSQTGMFYWNVDPLKEYPRQDSN